MCHHDLHLVSLALVLVQALNQSQALLNQMRAFERVARRVQGIELSSQWPRERTVQELKEILRAELGEQEERIVYLQVEGLSTLR